MNTRVSKQAQGPLEAGGILCRTYQKEHVYNRRVESRRYSFARYFYFAFQ